MLDLTRVSRRLRMGATALAFSLSLGLAAAPAPERDPDKILLTFAMTGDTRLDPAYNKYKTAAIKPNGRFTWDLLREFEYTNLHYDANTTYPFFFNAVQVKLTLRDLVALPHPPKYFFILGDEVMGFQRDNGDSLRRQLGDFGKALRLQSGMANIKVIPLPGNHEMTFKTFPVDKDGKPLLDKNGKRIPPQSGVWLEDSRAWKEWIEKNHFGPAVANGPHRDALEGFPLQEDQSDITYSFDEPLADGKLVHFIVLNTDTSNGQMTSEGYETLGLIPLKWVTKDIQDAQADSRVAHIFVLSHKPIRPPVYFQNAIPTDRMHDSVAEPFRLLLIRNSKVRALLCSHAHMWAAESLIPEEKDIEGRKRSHARPMQILAGNGGCDLEDFWSRAKNPAFKVDDPMVTWNDDEKEDRAPFYGFTVFHVHQSGKVTYNSYQRKVPDPCYAVYSEADMAKGLDRAVPRKRSVAIDK